MNPASIPADTLALAGRLALAALLGATLGVNRELFQKPAGLRTHALVSLGTALVTVVGLHLGQLSGDSATTGRVIQGLVAGVGFLGGGVILHGPDVRTVSGLTTAASIWIASGTGIAVGTGLWQAAVVAVVLSLLVLTVGHSLDNALHRISVADREGK